MKILQLAIAIENTFEDQEQEEPGGCTRKHKGKDSEEEYMDLTLDKTPPHKKATIGSYFKTASSTAKKRMDFSDVELVDSAPSLLSKTPKRSREDAGLETFGSTGKCTLCKQLIDGPTMSLKCAHGFCGPCINKYAELKIKSMKDTTEIACPGFMCSHVLQDRELRVSLHEHAL
jgi:hypothetical protein